MPCTKNERPAALESCSTQKLSKLWLTSAGKVRLASVLAVCCFVMNFAVQPCICMMWNICIIGQVTFWFHQLLLWKLPGQTVARLKNRGNCTLPLALHTKRQDKVRGGISYRTQILNERKRRIEFWKSDMKLEGPWSPSLVKRCDREDTEAETRGKHLY